RNASQALRWVFRNASPFGVRRKGDDPTLEQIRSLRHSAPVAAPTAALPRTSPQYHPEVRESVCTACRTSKQWIVCPTSIAWTWLILSPFVKDYRSRSTAGRGLCTEKQRQARQKTIHHHRKSCPICPHFLHILPRCLFRHSDVTPAEQ